MKFTLQGGIFLAVFGISLLAKAQVKTVPLWDENPPFTKRIAAQDELGEGGRITKVAVPELVVYLPKAASANQMAILICPGGGYGILAIQHEGHAIAKRYSELGYVAVVLKYRLPDEDLLNDSWKVPMADAQQGIRKLRQFADEWDFYPERVGILGFSAGGHLASSVSVHGERATQNKLASRPDFSILVYPVISMDSTITHQGSRKNLLGDQLNTEWEEYYSLEHQVNASTPPAFLVHAWDDKAVLAENSLRYAKALNELGTKVELHLFERGGHGFGMGNKAVHGNAASWIMLSDAWIKGLF